MGESRSKYQTWVLTPFVNDHVHAGEEKVLLSKEKSIRSDPGRNAQGNNFFLLFFLYE